MRLFGYKKNDKGPVEFLQVSAMDCGPAVMASALASYQIPFSFEKLRELCETDADGTSTDSLEYVLRKFGIDAEESLVPIDHLLLPDSPYSPSIILFRMGAVALHFVLLWRLEDRAIIMDPAKGVYKLKREELELLLYQHEATVPRENWDNFARSDDFLIPLHTRLKGIVGTELADTSVRSAVESSAEAIGLVDAAARMVEQLLRCKALPAANTIKFWKRITEDGIPLESCIPSRYFYAKTARDNPQNVSLSGTVLIRLRGLIDPSLAQAEVTDASAPVSSTATADQEEVLQDGDEAPREPLASTGLEYRERLLRRGRNDILRSVFSSIGKRGLMLMGLLACVVGLVTLMESLLFYSLTSVQRWLALPESQMLFLVLLIAFFAVVASASFVRESVVRVIGRHVEFGFRAGLINAFESLPPRFFETRQAADISNRLHSIPTLKTIPRVLFDVVKSAMSVIVLVAALFFVDVKVGGLLCFLMVVRIALSLSYVGKVSTLELRLMTLDGSLSVHYLQALLARMPIRAHVAEKIVSREHEKNLVAWSNGSRELLGTRVKASFFDELIYAIGFAGAVFLVIDEGLIILVVAYWFLQAMENLSTLTNTLLTTMAQLSGTLVRLFEPMESVQHASLELQADAEALDEKNRKYPGLFPERVDIEMLETAAPHRKESLSDTVQLQIVERPSSKEIEKFSASQQLSSALDLSRGLTAVEIEMRDVSVVRRRNHVLDHINLKIPAGAHVAIVGKSGAGKSTLASVLLGTMPITSGALLVNGKRINKREHRKLQELTSWVDPDVYLWNDSLWRNVCVNENYEMSFEEAVLRAELLNVVKALPHGSSSWIGEEGRMLSGGEGQRVRIARALVQGIGPLVVLDEAFRGLDPDLRVRLLGRVREASEDSTVLYVTHDIVSALYFDLVIVVSEGQVVEFGHPNALSAAEDSTFRTMLDRYRHAQTVVWGSDSTWSKVHMSDGKVRQIN